MGWSKRGNGRSYNSLNGYGTIIGFLSGKILDYATRNRKCAVCDRSGSQKIHDCRKNFEKSAKAMEADVAVQLICHSEILKNAGCRVKVLVGDEDQWAISDIRNELKRLGIKEEIYKLADRNHVKKNLSKKLYKLKSTNRGMSKPGLIKHIVKCFSYAVCQNIGASKKLAVQLDAIPDHLYGIHANCGKWCGSLENPKKVHKFQIKDPELYDELKRLFALYSENSTKYCINASSQANESVNNIFARQLPKNKCFSKSSSADIRVASGVLIKNEGPMYVDGIKKNLGLNASEKSKKHLLRAYKQRVRRAVRSKTAAARKQRMDLAKKNELTRKVLESNEETNYETNIGLELDLLNNSFSADTTTPPSSCKIVYFDLETSGTNRKTCEILQIAAKVDDLSFSTYVRPQHPIPEEASAVNKIEVICGELCYNKKQVPSQSIASALHSFSEFLKNLSAPCLMVAHNASYDTDVLLRAVRKQTMIQDFSKIIYGFIDSLPVFRTLFPERKGEGMFKLSKLAQDFLSLSDEQDFHEGLFDCKVLQELVVSKVSTDVLFQKINFFKDCMLNTITGKKKAKKSSLDKPARKKIALIKELKTVITDYMNKKLVNAGISYEKLANAFKHSEEFGIIKLLCENQEKPITKDQKILQKINVHFIEKKNDKIEAA